ncbi:MAG TPA: uracil-DNA glycosylase family protein, partial [Rhizomicrobium sp.]
MLRQARHEQLFAQITFNTAQVCRNAPGLIIRGAKTNPETTALAASEPPLDCALCPRLMQFRHANRKAHAEYFNNPVPRFGDANGRLLILGLAPGLHGANRTGRPFTGDHAGDLLYSSLIRHGLARGGYAARADDGRELIDCQIAHPVRCVPPDN